MTKSEITPEQKRMLEALTSGLPALAKDVHERLKGINGVQQKIAAHISMLQAYGWPVPHLEGVTIQNLSPEAAQALLNAQQASGPNTSTTTVVQPSAATVARPERASARKIIQKVLGDGSELTVPELREVIQQKHGQTLAVPTIYRILAEEAVRAGEGKWKKK